MNSEEVRIVSEALALLSADMQKMISTAEGRCAVVEQEIAAFCGEDQGFFTGSIFG
jgi:hypothetical protein